MARRPLLIWLLFVLVTGAIFLTYALTSLSFGHGEFVLPLDDVYIHFQYAKQIALGQPYIYNPGQPPTSGATSFIYPWLLAVGYLLGFQELRLSLWAMGIGALALLGSLWLVYRLLKAHDAPDWLAVLVALVFGVTGSVSWHFMAGMETGLMMLFMLATLYGVVTQRLRWFVVSASLLALTRPEGGVLAAIGVAVMFVRAHRRVPLRQSWLMIIPILAVFVQPLVNLLVTGSAVATGNSVKSILGTVPFYWDDVIRRILDNFLRMWVEFITGVSPREGLYVPYLVGPLALAFLIGGLFSRRYRLVNAMLLLWLLAGTASIATLDTAFWHFKRYQMPLIALLFPAAGWGLDWAVKRVGAQRAVPLRYAIVPLCSLGLIIALTTGAAFLDHFALNVGYVYAQPLQMARWLRANTPEDAVVAVHDVGMMRYMGERTTLDMVGLTTPGAAAYWRNGPGSVAEFLIQERPDYIASYGKGHGLGLELIANTRIYGDPLAEFPVDLDPNYNVALAADYQGIYQPDWESVPVDWVHYSLQPSQTGFNLWQGEPMPNTGSGWVNVGNIESENRNNYQWSNQNKVFGFPTDVFELDYVSCLIEDCVMLDAGRAITGEESFSLSSGYPDSGGAWDVVLVTRLQPVSAGTLDIYANGELVGTRWIPEIPGKWLEIATLIPRDIVLKNHDIVTKVDIRIVPHMGDSYYMPFYHWIDGAGQIEPRPEDEIAAYQDGHFFLSSLNTAYEPDTNQLKMALNWYTDGSAEGDYRFFAHIYNDINQPPIAQYDNYPNNGTLPPGNWLPGALHDEVEIDLSNVPPGTYKLAIGFYNPYTGERLMPESDVYEVSPDGRLWLDDVVVPGE
jgi:hypothetical protein